MLVPLLCTTMEPSPNFANHFLQGSYSKITVLSTPFIKNTDKSVNASLRIKYINHKPNINEWA